MFLKFHFLSTRDDNVRYKRTCVVMLARLYELNDQLGYVRLQFIMTAVCAVGKRVAQILALLVSSIRVVNFSDEHALDPNSFTESKLPFFQSWRTIIVMLIWSTYAISIKVINPSTFLTLFCSFTESDQIYSIQNNAFFTTFSCRTNLFQKRSSTYNCSYFFVVLKFAKFWIEIKMYKRLEKIRLEILLQLGCDFA